MQSDYKIGALCETLGINRHNYYYRPHSKEIPEAQIKAVKQTFLDSRRAYGVDKITEQLRKDGMAIAPKTVSKIMKRESLISKYVKKRQKQQPNKTNRDDIPDLLNRNFGGKRTCEVVVSDLTYVDVNKKWYYICLIIELSHREILGAAASANKDAELVKYALYNIKGDLRKIDMFHSDRGGEFKNEELDRIFTAFGIKRSLSRPGKPIDNAVAESMYNILKTEFVFDETFSDLNDLRVKLASWVDWYNNRRLHGSLGMKTPVESRQMREIGVPESKRFDYREQAKKNQETETVVMPLTTRIPARGKRLDR